jgi:uncharacterized protein (DUF1778 family)
MARARANPGGRGPAKKTLKRPDTREALNMRIRPELRDLIDRAAEATGKNRTDFVLDAARQAAQATLLDQVHVQLNPEAYAAFLRRLDAPPQANERLRKTMQTPPVWA